MNFNKYLPYITEQEIICQCGCGNKYVSKQFLDKLLRARKMADMPFKFNSMCRCRKHNKVVGGSDSSSHISEPDHECCAADIHFNNSRELFFIHRSLLFAGFTRMGINYDKKFIHVDDDQSKDQFVEWIY